MPNIDIPKTLSVNAWTGSKAPTSPLPPSSLIWGLSRRSAGPTSNAKVLLPHVIDDRDWRDDNVGWGLVLPDNPKLGPAILSGASDAPQPLQDLVALRNNAPVFRYLATAQDGYLRRYSGDAYQDFSLVGSKAGIKPGCLPRYLLLYGSPDVIPWDFQYTANLTHYVGRLDLEGEELKRYVDALISGWDGMHTNPRAPVVWSVSHGYPDITWLMEETISKEMDKAFENDPDHDLAQHAGLFGPGATRRSLIDTLVAKSPSLVITTSHGMTGPLDDPPKLKDQLGNVVDTNRDVLDSEDLIRKWEPNGAIWYSHACCSAGSDAPSCYADLLDPASDVTAMLKGVAEKSGKRVAPLPRKLLGAEKPLRAFVGHVEPTFDWTLRDPETGQPLSATLREALYDRLFQAERPPLGWAMARVFDDASDMLGLWAASISAVNRNVPKSREWALYRQLTALDRQHTVILGDPTVSLPVFSAGGL